MRADRLLLIMGMVACLASLALALVDARGALTGWLGAASAFVAIPAGALCLQAMIRLIPGTWGEEMRLSCEAGGMMAIPASIAFLPVLVAIPILYPDVQGGSAFRMVWMQPVAFMLRTLLWFGLLAGAAVLLRRRWQSTRVAAIFLMLFPLLGSFVAVDWLMALTPEFASSSFGLTLLILWATMAFTTLLLLRLPMGRPPRKTGVVGAVLLTLLLMWAYIQFLSFFINWSPGLQAGASCYGQRIGDGWTVVAALFGALGGVPLLMLILPQIRRSRVWLVRLSVAVLAGKVGEFGWLALPGRGRIAIAAFVLAAGGLALVAVALLPMALRIRIAARQPRRRA